MSRSCEKVEAERRRVEENELLSRKRAWQNMKLFYLPLLGAAIAQIQLSSVLQPSLRVRYVCPQHNVGQNINI